MHIKLYIVIFYVEKFEELMLHTPNLKNYIQLYVFIKPHMNF